MTGRPTQQATAPPTQPRGPDSSAAREPRGPKRAHAPRMPFAVLVTALIVGGLCALLALNTASAANELNRHNLAVKDASVAAQLQQLQNQVAASAAPGSLGSAAAALGMIPAGNPAFLSVGPDGKVTVLGNPSPASLPTVAAPSPPKPNPSPTKTDKKKKPRSSSSPSPTPTPTPTTTLPGGTR